MKKSLAIFITAVSLLMFYLISSFGTKIKVYNPTTYVESINVNYIQNDTDIVNVRLIENKSGDYYWSDSIDYKSNTVLKISYSIAPLDATYQEITIINNDINVATVDENNNITVLTTGLIRLKLVSTDARLTSIELLIPIV